MPVLERFACPGNLTELPEDGQTTWSESLSTDFFGPFASEFPRFFDPTVTDTPADHNLHVVCWNAFPATLHRKFRSKEARWKAADDSRDVQDEYCEWSVRREGDDITAVTFTTETPEYFNHLRTADPELLTKLYHEFVGREVKLTELLDDDGNYDPLNSVNMATPGRIAHLAQETNTLGAAVRLAAEATVLRRSADGRPIVNQQALVRCSRLGEPLRNSDPQIASAVNNRVAEGFDITLANPPGLHIAGLITAGMKTPDDIDPREFWTIERGTEAHALRARFEVPRDLGFVSDILVDERPITRGAQLADRVQVKLIAASKQASFDPTRKPCVT